MASASRIDWKKPWFAPYRATGERVTRQWNQGRQLQESLSLERPSAVRFCSHDELPVGEPYETFILRTGTCPTRSNLHDLFNGLVWLKFPLTKSGLNQIQSAQIAEGAIHLRGPVRDAITIFDENGALLHAPQSLWDALVARDWRRLFIDLRPLWDEAHLVIFGHALLEKLTSPRKVLTAHIWRATCPQEHLDRIDAWLAAQLTGDVLASKPFTPLPVMGVPGWSDENQNFSFYDDSLVFRPGRQPDSNTTTPTEATRP